MEEEPELARQFRVMSIPTLMTFKDGKVGKPVRRRQAQKPDSGNAVRRKNGWIF